MIFGLEFIETVRDDDGRGAGFDYLIEITGTAPAGSHGALDARRTVRRSSFQDAKMYPGLAGGNGAGIARKLRRKLFCFKRNNGFVPGSLTLSSCRGFRN